MVSREDGVIKYDRSGYHPTGALDLSEYEALESWRKKLFQLELIGEYDDLKVGYGNLSELKSYSNLLAFKGPQFLITGTQTGKFSDLDGRHYTKVVGHDSVAGTLISYGPLEPSSEALTHAAIYEAAPEVRAIFHIHDTQIWEGMIAQGLPYTPADIEYGTCEMAECVRALTRGKNSGSFVMRGHQDGVIAFATTLDAAGAEILKLYQKFVGNLT